MGLKKLACITALTFLVSSPQYVTLKQVAKETKEKNVVYFGEIHDSKNIHKAQTQFLKELYKNNKDLSVAMEMVQRDYQQVLDEYLSTNMSEAELKTKLNWKETWSHDFKMYKPLFKFAKEKKLDLIALNAPRKIIKKIAKQGLSSLIEEDFEYIPRNIYLDDKEYKDLYETLKKAHPNTSKENDETFYRKKYEAQSTWNETMAQAIVGYLAKESKHVLVIAGDGHLKKPGIPGRVERRAKKENLKIEASIISPTKGDYVIKNNHFYKQQNS